MMIGMKVNFHKILLMGWKVVDFVFVFWWLQGQQFCNFSILIFVNFVDFVWNSSILIYVYVCICVCISHSQCVCFIFWGINVSQILCNLNGKDCVLNYFLVIYTILNAHNQTLADQLNIFYEFVIF
jgi:hypothetical protein